MILETTKRLALLLGVAALVSTNQASGAPAASVGAPATTTPRVVAPNVAPANGVRPGVNANGTPSTGVIVPPNQDEGTIPTAGTVIPPNQDEGTIPSAATPISPNLTPPNTPVPVGPNLTAPSNPNGGLNNNVPAIIVPPPTGVVMPVPTNQISGGAGFGNDRFRGTNGFGGTDRGFQATNGFANGGNGFVNRNNTNGSFNAPGAVGTTNMPITR